MAIDWMGLAELGYGAYSANKKSKAAMSIDDLKKLWMYQNPSVNTPTYSTSMTDDGNGGTVRNTQYTPEIQALFEQFVGQQGQPREQYDSNLGELNNAQGNYQRSRYGLGPEEYAPDEIDAEQPNYGDGNDQDAMPSQQYQPGMGPTTADQSNRGTNRLGAGGGGMGGSSGGGYNSLYNGTQQGPVNTSSGSGSGWSNPFSDTFNASDLEKLFGQQDVGSEAQLTLSENGNLIGRGLGLLTGIPGLGMLGGYLGDRNIENKTWMNPTDPYNPYGGDTLASNIIRDNADQGLGRSGMNQGNTTFTGTPIGGWPTNNTGGNTSRNSWWSGGGVPWWDEVSPTVNDN